MRAPYGFFQTAFRHIRRFPGNRGGGAVLIFAISLVPMLLAAGGAVDFTRYYDAEQNVQTALDAATLAGAAVYDGSNGSTSVGTAEKTFSSWNKAFNGSISDTTFLPTQDSDALYVTGSTQVSLKMYFTGLVGLKTLNFTVTSKAERLAGSSSDATGECFWIRTTVNLKGTWNSPSCQINVLEGGSTVDTQASVTTPKFCNVSTFGTYNPNGKTIFQNSDGDDSLVQNCTDYTSYIHDVPTVSYSSSCSSTIYYTNNNGKDRSVEQTSGCNYVDLSGGNITLTPGVYTYFDIKNSAKVTFEPGIYIINGSWIFDGITASGDGVVFYLTKNGSILYNSSNDIDFSAPTDSNCGTYNSINTCDYSGTLLFSEKSDSDCVSSGSSACTLTLNSSTSYNFDGLIYLPSYNILFNSSTKLTHSGDVVAYQMTLDDSSVWTQSGSGSTTTTAEYGPPRLIK